MKLLIVFAFPLELQATVERLKLVEEDNPDLQWLYRGEVEGHEVTAAATGVGREVARDVSRRLAEQLEPDLILYSGFTGALVRDSEVGDLVVPREVLLWEGSDLDGLGGSLLDLPSLGVTADAETVRAIERAAESIGARVERRPLVTVDVVVREPEQKRKLGRASGAAAVDMESAASLTCAAELGVPCAVVRVISDDIDDRIPEELSGLMGPDGKPRAAEIARLAKDPELLLVLRRLGQNGSNASQRLADLFEAWLTG
jgi:nucleoside phosphorylase